MATEKLEEIILDEEQDKEFTDGKGEEVDVLVEGDD